MYLFITPSCRPLFFNDVHCCVRTLDTIVASYAPPPTHASMHTSTQTHRHSRTPLGLLRTHALTRSFPTGCARRSASHSCRVVLKHGTEVRWHGVDHGKERPWAAWRWHDDEQSRLRAGQRVVWSVWHPRFCRIGPNIAHTLEHTRSLWTS